jgi:hypothetical protein
MEPVHPGPVGMTLMADILVGYLQAWPCCLSLLCLPEDSGLHDWPNHLACWSVYPYPFFFGGGGGGSFSSRFLGAGCFLSIHSFTRLSLGLGLHRFMHATISS